MPGPVLVSAANAPASGAPIVPLCTAKPLALRTPLPVTAPLTIENAPTLCAYTPSASVPPDTVTAPNVVPLPKCKVPPYKLTVLLVPPKPLISAFKRIIPLVGAVVGMPLPIGVFGELVVFHVPLRFRLMTLLAPVAVILSKKITSPPPELALAFKTLLLPKPTPLLTPFAVLPVNVTFCVLAIKVAVALLFR